MDVVDRRLLARPADAAELLPEGLPEPFSTVHIADGLGRPRWFAQKVAYCLRTMGAIQQVGKHGHTVLYTRAA